MSFLLGSCSRARVALRPYRGVFLAASIGAIVIGAWSMQGRAAIAPGNPNPGPPKDARRSCSSDNTVFEGVTNIDELIKIFKTEASLVTEERMKILSTPSEWKCPKSGTDPADPKMPKLTSLAARLPGWSYEYPSPFGLGTVTLLKPVTFSAFSSIMSELGREYECRLTELQDLALPLVLQNADLPTGTEFCCSFDQCQQVGPTVSCAGPVTEDPLCDMQCSSKLSTHELITRVNPFYERTSIERKRARVAIERTISFLRSYDLNYAHARDLMCYARASMDLRAELSLLADATSCMPKIWDAVTSIHDSANHP